MTSKPKSKPAAKKSLPETEPKAARKQPAAVRSAKASAPAKPAKAALAPAPAIPAKPKASEPAPANELSADVMEFITAIDEYKRQRRRPFPSWSEIFEIVKALGYKKSA